MKAIIGGVAGALVLGGALLLANARSASPAAPQALTSAPAQAAAVPYDALRTSTGLVPAGSLAPETLVQPVNYPVAAPPQQVVERVVYVDRPVTRTVTRTPVRRTAARTVVVRKDARSWKKSALIIGGSAAGGAGVGALLGGGGGAKKGAIVGGIGGLVYDLATRNR